MFFPNHCLADNRAFPLNSADLTAFALSAFPFRFFLPPAAGERVILSLADSFPHKSFACGERRLQSKKKSRLAAGVAPVQVASLSVFGNYKKLLVIFYALFGAIHGSRAANRDL